jgi:16S rRNA processing protein RimM
MADVDPVEVGRFGKAFGVLGWIKVISFTIPEDNILKFKPWLIKKNGLWKEIYFVDSKRHAGSIVVKLSGCDSPEKASEFTNIKIAVKREQLPELEDNERYWHDLVGLKVINKAGDELGVVQNLIETGSNDVLVVMGEKRILIPYTSEVVVRVDLQDKLIMVDWEKDYL